MSTDTSLPLILLIKSTREISKNLNENQGFLKKSNEAADTHVLVHIEYI